MVEAPNLSLLQKMRENKRTVSRWFERMMQEASEFGEMVQRNQAPSPCDKKNPRDDDWNVDGR
jgi:hypothetical protein